MSSNVIQERVRFASTPRQLDGELVYPRVGRPWCAVVVVGPHPYMGGTMTNTLVEAIASHMAATGGVALRFDYGGTGASQGPPIDVAASMDAFWQSGHAPEDPDRIADAAAAIRFVNALDAGPLALIGYSFGCYAAICASRDVHAAATILISPTITKHDFGERSVCTGPLLVIHSKNDFATPSDQVERWFDALSEPKERQCIDGGDHFFRGVEPAIATECATFLAPFRNAPTVGEKTA